MAADSINVLDLSAATDSKITHISLYSSRAEVTRTCTFKIKPGVNKVKLNGLSNDLDTNSLRVEGRGLGTIHDVTPSFQSPPPISDTSPQLIDLKRTLALKKRALERSQQSLTALNQFLATLNIEHVNPASLGSIVENYETAAAAVDLKILELETEIEKLEAGSALERQRLQVPVDYDAKLRRQVSVGVVAEEEGEFTLIITYAVSRARWSASYDIRVNTQAKTEPVTLVYKASISQSTDESWDNVPITLETATPTIGNKMPALNSWSLSVLRPIRPTPVSTARFLKRAISAEEHAEESDDDMGFGLFDGEPTDHIGAYVTSKGNVSATFRIPGVVTIPGDGSFNTFTIAELKLDAALSWISIPRVEPKVHLTAKIKNSSSFTLLPGTASVYVDKSFISETHMAGVSPMEKFECPLGLDDTIRITYHPQSKKQSQSGFYNKSVVHVYSQRITVHNTKPDFVVENLKILDHIPVSQDEEIKVKLVEPALALPGSGTAVSGNIQGKEVGGRALPLAVVDGATVAQWEGSEDMDVDVASLGKDGKLYWLCTIPPQEKLNLTLQWEISAPAKTSIVGL